MASLVLRANQVVSLGHMSGALWEDAEPPSPPATLRVHVSRLRQALAAYDEVAGLAVVTATNGYRLDVAPESVDALRFEQLASAGRHELAEGDARRARETLERALGQWRDRVLADVPHSQALLPEIVRLEEARLSAIEDKVEAELRCGRHHEMVEELERLVGEAPLRERIWGQRMVALYRCGRQAEALRAYEELRVLLRDELGINPNPQLQQLQRSILEQEPSLDDPDLGGSTLSPVDEQRGQTSGLHTVAQSHATSPRFPARLVPPDTPPLSGRSSELEGILRAWEGTMRGSLRILLVSGEAGVGKTRLVSEAARRAHQQGTVVLFGHCDEDMGVAFQPFVEALNQALASSPPRESLGRYAGELARLVPDLDKSFPSLEPPLRADPETERFRLFDAVAGWLHALSSDAGVFLVLDDLHCAAKPTLLLLRHLARSPEQMRMLVVGTYRDTDLDRSHPLTEMLADLRREPRVERLALGGIDAAGVEEMMTGGVDTLDERAAGLAELVHSQANGNPFFVEEVLRALVESRRLLRQRGTWTTRLGISDLEIPEGVREVVGRRVNRLGQETQTVLALAAVIGAAADFDLVVEASGLDEETVLDALDEATGASLLRETSSGAYEFSHALVRSTLYDEQSAVRRARRHRRVAEVLEARGGKDAAALAYHFQRAGGADARAVEYAAAAGEQAMARLAFDQAAEFFAQAIEAAEDVGTGRARVCELLIRQGTAQRLAGVPSFRETLLGAERLASELDEAELLAGAALANSRGLPSGAGAVDSERVFYLEEAISAAGPGDSPSRARLMSLLAVELVWGDPELWRLGLAREAVEMARRVGDDACLLDVWKSAHVSCSVADETPRLVEEVPALVELAEKVGDPQQLALVCGAGALHLIEMGRLPESERLIERTAMLAADLDNPFFHWLVANGSCLKLTITGTGDEIEQAGLAALEIGQEAAQPDLLAWFAPQLFVARWSQGRLAEVVDMVRGVEDDAASLPAWRGALALVLARAGEALEARRIVDSLCGDPRSVFERNVAWLLAHSVLAEAVGLVGTPDQAAAEYEVLLPYEGRLPCLVNVARPSVDSALATLAAVAGRDDRADAHFETALDFHTRLGARGWLARTKLEWGRSLAGRDANRARPLLEEARDGASATGASDVVRDATELLALLS